jgi:predicted nucleotidyltransferase
VSGTLAHLKQHEQEAIKEFIGRLLQLDEVQTNDVWLFGSKSRGDFDADSDIDLLLVLETVDWKRKERIRMTDSRVSLEYDVLLNTHILSRERWEELTRHQATLWREVQRDGVALMPRPERAPKAN